MDIKLGLMILSMIITVGTIIFSAGKYKQKFDDLENNHFKTIGDDIRDLKTKITGVGNSLDRKFEELNKTDREQAIEIGVIKQKTVDMDNRIGRIEKKVYNGVQNG